jgi:hypothetical protein
VRISRDFEANGVSTNRSTAPPTIALKSTAEASAATYGTCASVMSRSPSTVPDPPSAACAKLITRCAR